MTRGLSDRIRATAAATAVRMLAVAIAVGVSAFAGAVIFGIRINATMSEPIGLYRQSTDPSAASVEFCTPPQGRLLSFPESAAIGQPAIVRTAPHRF